MSTNLMKALRFAEFGPPSVLRIEEVPIPEPGDGEALVRVKAAAINPSDIGDVAGHFKKTTLPRTPGRDFAGVVVKGKQHEGEEVWGSAPNLGIVRDGSHAEYVVVPAETLSPKPKSLSMAPVSYTHLDVYKRQDLNICSRCFRGRLPARVPYVSALFVAFLITSTAILTVIFGVFGAYCAISAVLAAVNPSRPTNTLSALLPEQGRASGD